MAFDKQTFQDLFGASILDEKSRRGVKSKIFARCFDEALTPLLWFLLPVTFVFCAPFTRFNGLIAWIIFSAFLNFIARLWRESYGVWRDYPYWRSLESTRQSDRSVALPFWTTYAIFLFILLSGGYFGSFFIVACLLILIDRSFAFWTRRFAERTIRAGIELLRSSKFDVEKSNDAPFAPTEKNETLSLEKSTGNAISEDIFEASDDEIEEEGTVISSQRRTKTADGEERITGEALVEFEQGAEVAVVNVAFCPSFKGVPAFEYEQVSGSDVAIKTTLVQPFGVRLEVKRRNASTETEPTRLEFFACYPLRE